MRDPCIASFLTLIGTVSITEDGDGNITGLYLPNCNLPAMDDRLTRSLEEASVQVNEYLSGKRRSFDLPLSYDVSEFREAVLEAIMDIPYGETRTYSEIASEAGSPKAARAVGTACAENPIPIIIPCHRVVPSSGGIGSYAGGSVMKQKLLDLENDSR